MKIETKFSNGDKVYTISRQVKDLTIPCPSCGGEGLFIGKDNNSFMCPTCRGRKYISKQDKPLWYVVGPYEIGQVRVEITGESEGLDPESMFMNYGPQKYKYIEQYMCAETGIKSGTLYYANMLFATEEEAQKLCDERNNES